MLTLDKNTICGHQIKIQNVDMRQEYSMRTLDKNTMCGHLIKMQYVDI